MTALKLTRSIIVDASRRTRSASTILLVAAVVTFVIATATLAGVSALRLASTLAPRLSGQFTVAVWSRGLESADAAAARAAERLSRESGIRSVEILEASDQDTLIGAIVDGRKHGQQQPRLITLRSAPGVHVSNDRLENLLSEEHVEASIDEHVGMAGPLERTAWTFGGIVSASCLIFAGGLILICFRTGRAAVLSNDLDVSLLDRLGADADFIGSRVAQEFIPNVMAGASFGLFSAIIVFVTEVVGRIPSSSAAGPLLSHIDLGDCVWMAPGPVIVLLLAMWAMRRGASRVIVQRERLR